MSATLLSDLPQAICDEIRTVLPDLKQCAPFAGKFDAAELKKSGVRTPAVLVSILGARQSRTFAGHHFTFDLQMAAAVLVGNTLGETSRDAHALNISQALLQILPPFNAGAAFGQGEAFKLHPDISVKTRDQGVSLWAVSWELPVSLVSKIEAPLGVQLYVAQAPNTGAGNAGGYEEIGGET